MTGHKLRKKILDATIGTLRAIDYIISVLLPAFMPKPDTSTPIDIAIPCIPKDLPTLPLCIESIRKNIPHNIKKIYLIGPNTTQMRQAAESLKVSFVDETSILPGSPQQIQIDNEKRQNRKGWIFQQFLKLSGNIGKSEYILFIDADHILLKPHTFLTHDGKTVFYTSKEFYLPYYDNIKRLTGQCRFARHSFIAHKMLFRKSHLNELKTHISPNGNWKETILNSLDWTYPSPFSEFELYPRTIPIKESVYLPWRQKLIKSIPKTLTIESLKKKYSRYLSITIPEYLRKS
ncbi:MAG: DUF6492 family protein [Prevotella sp.]|nr:DUF6492 family protein [Bacteroides sp.]MCM1367067.1 DUF6492 family protein [Prevotella sp.]MCM1437551.1 DUF6492 family protein [Prevotella sp.]